MIFGGMLFFIIKVKEIVSKEIKKEWVFVRL